MEISIPNVHGGWREVLNLYQDCNPVRLATRHGISFDIAGLTVRLQNPYDLTSPPNYLYPELIHDYRDRLFGEQREKSLFYQRLRKWQGPADTNFDQLDGISQLLSREHHSRSAVFSVWQPTEDLASQFPVSPVGGCFRIVGKKLVFMLTARSVDVWLGLVPELLAFCQLTRDMSLRLHVDSAEIIYHAWSAHLYEIDYLTYSGRAQK